MFLEALYFFLKANVHYKLSIKKNSVVYLCGKSLNQITFRLPKNASKDWMISIRLMKRLLMAQVRSKNVKLQKSQPCIFDTTHNSKAIRKEYLKNFTGIEVDNFIAKSDLIGYSTVFQACINGLIVCLMAPVFILLSVLSKDKKHLPFLLSEAIECSNLYYILKNNRVSHIYYFSIFERDANSCAYFLMNKGINITKVPSEVPLFVYNSCVVASTLSFCFEYQREEFEHYKQTMFVDKTKTWGPELIFNAPKEYLSKETTFNETVNCDLGFYSSGNWLRKLQGDAELETDDAGNEHLILSKLSEIAIKHNLRLRIYCHPIEKQNQAQTLQFYSKYLTNSLVQLADFSIKSIEDFKHVNISVSLLSTLMYERIYFGLKAILVPIGFDDFPIKNSGLSNICLKDLNQLEEKILISLGVSHKDFFASNKLLSYSFKYTT